MTDLPQHAAQIGLLRVLAGSGAGFADRQDFIVNWFTPYLLGYLLVYTLVPLTGLVVACKVVVSLALVFLPISTRLVLSETAADVRWAMLTIPALYGFSYQWGLLNFLVAAPLGIVFLWIALRQMKGPTRGRSLLLGTVLTVLFFAHVMTAVFFGLVAGLLFLGQAASWRSALRLSTPLALVALVGLVWSWRMSGSPLVQRGIFWDLNWLATADFYYQTITSPDSPGSGWGRASGLLPRLFGMQPGAATALVALAVFLLPLAAGARFSRRPALWTPLAACMCVLFFAPGSVFGTDFTFQRFTVFCLPLYLVVCEQPPGRQWPKWTWPAAACIALACTCLVTWNAIRYEQEGSGFTRILERMEPGQRALSFVFERGASGAIAPVFLHYPSWYGGLKQGVVDPSVASTYVKLVLYRPDRIPVARLWDFEWLPERWNWQRFGGERYRYFVVRSLDDKHRLFDDATCRVSLLLHVNLWWLYERDPSCRTASVE